MAKSKKIFACQSCGAQHPQWLGQCKSCGEWNTIVEEVVSAPSKNALWEGGTRKTTASKGVNIITIASKGEERLHTGDEELNRVLGGGLVSGSVVLLGGEPGIGKSTLLLQMATRLTETKVLYVSGEESEMQIKMRAERIGIKNNSCFVLTETGMKEIFEQAEAIAPDIMILDSIQTLYSDLVDSTPGSVTQIRQCTGELIRFAKSTNTPVILVGHITKDGSLAGPKVLEHMVDTVLQFEGERNYNYRLLRSIKNRFGSTSELGIYEMQQDGLRQVSNPSEILITQRDEPLSGVAISASIEGMRPLLIEIQALVSTAVYGNPQRSATGFDLRRLNMLLAVLEKRCGFRLGTKDVFLNIAGGLRVDDPAIDLAVVCAVLSSSEDLALNPNYCFAAEIGLTGEIRPVNRIDQRIAEAEKLGFKRIYCSKYNKIAAHKGIEIIQAARIEDIFQSLFS
jgi:DNA repair protein RadA/Sms